MLDEIKDFIFEHFFITYIIVCIIMGLTIGSCKNKTNNTPATRQQSTYTNNYSPSFTGKSIHDCEACEGGLIDCKICGGSKITPFTNERCNWCDKDGKQHCRVCDHRGYFIY